MRKNKILEKLLAIILIFTLTSANFAFVTQSVATSFVETLFGKKAETGHENVEFESYFGTEAEKETSVISDVNNEELSISMNLNVKKEGYLKDAKIEIAETEEGKGLNFKVKEMEELPEYVQGFEDNCVYMQQINHSSEVKVELPIEYKNERYVNENKFSNSALVKFSGIYVDGEGEENEVSREIELTVSWKDQREVKVETEAVKYLDYRTGTILQTVVRVNSETDKNTLPVKESEIIIDVPTLENVLPTSITVDANNTFGTNGKSADTINFNEDNWEYNKEENKLKIKVVNEKQLVKVDEFENEFLKEADREIVEEERYYNQSGTDEYVVTYSYEHVNIPETSTTVKTNIEAKVVTFSGVEREENINIITNNNNYDYLLEGKTGEIVSLNIENETKEISKGYTYANYNNNQYENEIVSKLILNVSNSEAVKTLNLQDVENVYIDKEGNEITNNDLYYKQLVISKPNFLFMLGESGEIKVSDLSGNEIASINNETEVNEDENIIINFEQKYDKLNIETTEPLTQGNIVITAVKAMQGTSIDKSVFQNIAEIVSKMTAKADYELLNERVEVQTQACTTKLVDTKTNATLKMDRDSLSTLVLNEDVELRVELNNDKDTSDMYGHSVYEIELPENIDSIEVTNVSTLYGEGLEIVSAEVVGKVIRLTVDGKQEGINTGVLTNGTNLLINANIKVNLYAPAKEDVIRLKYVNDEATNYINNGVSDLFVTYSAPTGLVAVNSIANYNNLGSVTTSVRQGTQEDLIDIYSESKVATMEIIVMNNNGNTVSNVAILGRIPFAGVKDIETGKELGTTVDTRIVSGISSDEHNNTTFNIYYSENGEATKDLNDSNNGWTMVPESLNNVKSYLLVPADENYEMQDAQVLRFTYDYEIPGNLSHNEDIYGTFLAYYTNNSDIAIIDETSTPDLVGLTTGEGPELSIEVDSEKDTVKVGEELNIKVKVKNIGSDRVENVVATTPIQDWVQYLSVSSNKDEISTERNGRDVIVSLPSLEKDDALEFTITTKAKDLPTIAKYYANTEGFLRRSDGVYVIRKYNEPAVEGGKRTYEDTEITSLPDVKIELNSKVIAKDLMKEISADKKEVNLKEAEFELNEYAKDFAVVSETKPIGTQYDLALTITNCSSKEQNNIVATKVLPAELAFVSANVEDNKGTASYDESTRTITWNIPNLSSNGYINLEYSIKVASLPEGVNSLQLDNYTSVRAENSEVYTSNNLQLNIGKAVLSVTQTTSTTDTYIKEGDKVNYIFNVKNEGSVTAKSVSLADEVPEGLNVRKMSYISNGIVNRINVSSNSQAVVDMEIAPNAEVTVNVEAIADVLDGVKEKTVTNKAVLSSPTTEEQRTNEITHIIEQSEKSVLYEELSSSTGSSSHKNGGSTGSNVTKTYKISGLAWEDENRNGMRDNGERLLSGIVTRLVSASDGVILKSATTDGSGNYNFSGVPNGDYLVIFDFDTIKYTATAYKKDGVEGNVNSDAIMTKLEQDGKTRNGAISDTIKVENSSVSGIDIGLTLADTFDLKLEKTIASVMVNTSNDNHVDNYEEPTTFAKTEIGSKYVSGSTVYVEYNITVTNVGEIAGYAKKIVDYIPEGMTFNSSLKGNEEWYTGTDGNLYSTALSEKELLSGQSKTLKLVLTKQLTEENTGLVNNLAEICEDYNIYGVTDKNSTPENKAQGENDLGLADLIIGIKTGEVFIHISVIITSILLGSIVIFIAYNKIVLSKRKGGV